jgi:hypothetical protein
MKAKDQAGQSREFFHIKHDLHWIFPCNIYRQLHALPLMITSDSEAGHWQAVEKLLRG